MQRWLVFVSLLFCTACQMGTRYCAPCVAAPETWKGSHVEGDLPCCEEWWELFGDETLDQLEKRAIACNPDMRLAMQRVAEARALAGVDRSQMQPQVSIGADYSDTSQLFQFFGPTNIFSNLGLTNRVFRIHQLWYSLPLSVSYELDLWGKLRSQYQARCMTVQAREAALRTARLALSSEVAMAYFSLCALDEQITLYEKTVGHRKRSLDLTEEQHANGLSDCFAVTQATRELASVESDLIDLRRQRQLQENLLAMLVGTSPSCLELPSCQLRKSGPPQLPAGVPSTVLLRRPDLAEAEREMAARHAETNVAYASFFPSLEISASSGFFSPTLSEFLEWISRYLSYGGGVNQTLFDGGRKGSNLQLACARFHQADANYQKQVLVALREVEDALSNLQKEKEQEKALVRSTSAAREAATLAEQRYLRGLNDYLSVVDSENAALEAERELVQLQQLRYLSTVQLVKALGGGWE